MNAKNRKILKGTRIYDNGGLADVYPAPEGWRGTVDRYTVCYPAYCLKPISRIVGDDLAGKTSSVWEASGRVYPYLCMSESPFHPQGVGQHGEHWQAIDRPRHKHLGKRISFDQLPENCQQAVLQDILLANR